MFCRFRNFQRLSTFSLHTKSTTTSEGHLRGANSCAMPRLMGTASIRGLINLWPGLPQPHPCLRRLHSSQLGASSFTGFKYCPTFPHRPLSTRIERSLLNHDEQAIQDIIEGLLLMSQLKYV
jgi:hypothetical protein